MLQSRRGFLVRVGIGAVRRARRVRVNCPANDNQRLTEYCVVTKLWPDAENTGHLLEETKGAVLEERKTERINRSHTSGSHTYWYYSPRGFANEYTIGVCTISYWRDYYLLRGYEQIDHERVLRELLNEGDATTQVFAKVDVDGDRTYDRFEVGRLLTENSLRPNRICEAPPGWRWTGPAMTKDTKAQRRRRLASRTCRWLKFQ